MKKRVTKKKSGEHKGRCKKEMTRKYWIKRRKEIRQTGRVQYRKELER